MSRYIDAERLKREVRKAFPSLYMRTEINTLVNLAPSIDIDRPQGSWKEDYNGGGFKEWLDITCSLCGETLHDIQKNPKDYKYCPFCGARMKGADDE